MLQKKELQILWLLVYGYGQAVAVAVSILSFHGSRWCNQKCTFVLTKSGDMQREGLVMGRDALAGPKFGYQMAA